MDKQFGALGHFALSVRPGWSNPISLDVENVDVDWMVASGRRRGGKPGIPALRRGLVVRNVAEHVTVTREPKLKATVLL